MKYVVIVFVIFLVENYKIKNNYFNLKNDFKRKK